MRPIKRNTRTAFRYGPKVKVASVKDSDKSTINDEDLSMFDNMLSSDSYNEGGDLAFVGNEAPDPEVVDKINNGDEDKKMTSEEIKIKALKQAIDIAKLMSDVTTDDIIDIAKKVAKYIKG